MHEVSLCEGLIDIIREEATRGGWQRVRRVVLEIGALSHVDPEAMRFSFGPATLGSVAEGAALDIERPAGRAYCMDCSEAKTIGRHGDACPACGGHKLMVQSGDEMRLKELEVV